MVSQENFEMKREIGRKIIMANLERLEAILKIGQHHNEVAKAMITSIFFGMIIDTEHHL